MRSFITSLFVLMLTVNSNAQGYENSGEPLDSLYAKLQVLNDSVEYVDALLQLSLRYEDELRQLDSAFAYGEQALNIARRIGSVDQQVAAYYRMGYAQSQAGNWSAAESHQRKALSLARTTGSSSQIARVLLSLGSLIFSDQGGNEAEARKYFEEALELHRNDSITRALLGWKINFEIAKFYRKTNDKRERARLEDAFELSKGDDFRRLVIYLLADLEIRSNNYEAATRFYRSGLALEPATGSFQRGFVHYQLGEIFRNMGDADSTYKYMNAYASALHTSNDRRREIAVADAEARFQTREKQAKIERLALEDELSKAQISRQQTLIAGGLVLFGLLGAFLYFLLQQRRRIVAQNATIKKALSEKNTLLKEIHHRVKNNLQMVSSLLSLQGDFIEDDAALNAIEMGQQRVRSMAIIHQRLYLRDEVSTAVSARNYLDQLIGELMGTLNVHGLDLTLDKQLEDIDIDIDRMIPLGLVANEVITNALKHAFIGRERGKLTIRFQRVADDVELMIADDGIGGGGSVGREDSFGHLLVQTFTEQLEGDLRIDGEDGTTIRLRFPE